MNGAVRKERPRLRARMAVPALLAPGVALAVLAGCGGSSTTTASSVPASPAAAAEAASVSSADAVATVAGVPISKTSYEHWYAVERKLGATANPSHQALGFLITSEWVLGEAAARRLSLSEAEVKRRFAQLSRQSFPKDGSLQKYLERSGQSEADLLARIKVELLASRIAAKVTAGKPSGQRSAVLSSFERSFQVHWRKLTNCRPGYVMEDCRQYKGGPEDLTGSGASSAKSGASGGASAARGGSGGSSSSGSAASSSSGEVYTAPGAFSLGSSAFQRNGAIPAEYTCAGKGISPPLSWQKAPAKAASLFLFVIDDNASGASAGIRWVVGNIDPSSTGVAAGQTPAGGIVGKNSAGKAAYSAICPARGSSDRIEFVMYALSKKLPLATGFEPVSAEAEYGQHKLIVGESAVNYAVASR
jgi:phosphatidylethanolamine-binding protein (PEBP) family uncharacterized protein